MCLFPNEYQYANWKTGATPIDVDSRLLFHIVVALVCLVAVQRYCRMSSKSSRYCLIFDRILCPMFIWRSSLICLFRRCGKSKVNSFADVDCSFFLSQPSVCDLVSVCLSVLLSAMGSSLSFFLSLSLSLSSSPPPSFSTLFIN